MSLSSSFSASISRNSLPARLLANYELVCASVYSVYRTYYAIWSSSFAAFNSRNLLFQTTQFAESGCWSTYGKCLRQIPSLLSFNHSCFQRLFSGQNTKITLRSVSFKVPSLNNFNQLLLPDSLTCRTQVHSCTI